LKYSLHAGTEQVECELTDRQVVWQQLGPRPHGNPTQAIAEALSAPLDYPLINQAVVPGDRVMMVVDPEAPCWIEIANTVGRQLTTAGVDAESIHVLVNQPLSEEYLAKLRGQLQFPLQDYSEIISGQPAYLASTAEGERLYLPSEIVHADYVLTIGRFGFDENCGYRGTNSALYPAFASEEERDKLYGKSHRELTPEDSRGLRQRADEVGWLLGMQFSVQVIPSGSGELADVICGATESVFRAGVERINEVWRSPITHRADTAIVSVPGDEAGSSWHAFARACRAAAELVEEDGRVILMAQPGPLPDPLREMLAESLDDDKLHRRLNRVKTPPASALHALVNLSTKTKVFLYSSLDDDIAETLYCIPLRDSADALRAIEQGESYAVLDGAQYAYIDVE